MTITIRILDTGKYLSGKNVSAEEVEAISVLKNFHVTKNRKSEHLFNMDARVLFNELIERKRIKQGDKASPLRASASSSSGGLIFEY